MKLLILLAALLVFVTGLDYEKAIAEVNEAFPGINAVSPEIIKVVFDSGAFFDLGKNITPTEAKNQPDVDWNADKDAYYSLVFVDPDGPTKDNPFLRDLLLWLVGNIPGKDISAADVLVEYVNPAPSKHGPNRYFCFLYRQPEKLDFDEKRVDKYTLEGRLFFSTVDFVKKHKLGSPIGVNFATAYVDPYSAVLYKQLNCCEEYL